MSRFVNPVPQLYLDNGDIASSGLLEFYENKNYSTKKDTYSNSDLTVKNINPIQLDGQGRVPSCFGQGLYSVKFYAYDNAAIDKKGALQWTRDDVDFSSGSGNAFDEWSSVQTYTIGTVVKDSGDYYELYGSNTSKGERPSTTPSKWAKIVFITEHVAGRSYNIGDTVIKTGFLYRSNTNSNTTTPPGISWDNLTFNGTVNGDLIVNGNIECLNLKNNSFTNFPEVKTAFTSSIHQSITSSTWFIDPDLTIQTLPVGWYEIEAHLKFRTNGSTVNGIGAEIVNPAAGGTSLSSLQSIVWEMFNGNSDFEYTASTGNGVGYPNNPALTSIFRGRGMINLTSSSQICLAWRQGTTVPGTPTEVLSGYIKATRLKAL